MNPAQKVRVAINGFGRIGRSAFKVAVEEHLDEIEIVGINDLTEPKVLAHLLEYDTAYGHWDKEVSSNDTPTTHGSVTSKGALIVDGQNIPIFAEKEPKNLPWKDLKVDVVIESTGRFTDEEGMKQHLTAGAKKVVLSAPAKGAGIGTFLVGVNQDKYQNQDLINNASCTSNCLAPVVAIIHQKFGIAKGLYTTVHSVTAEQNLVDGPPPGEKHGDLRRARAAYANIIPTTTGAAVAVTQAIPEMENFLDGRAIRVPTIVGSITDLTVLLKRKTTIEEVTRAIKDACNEPKWKGVVAWTEEPLVSSDIIGRSESAIVDLPLTQLVDGDLLKVFAWYDNEWGYSNRLVEQAINVGKGSSRHPSEISLPADLPDGSQGQAGHQTQPDEPVLLSEHTLRSSPSQPVLGSTNAPGAAGSSGFASPQPPIVGSKPPVDTQNPLTLPPANPNSQALNPRGFFAQDISGQKPGEAAKTADSGPAISRPPAEEPQSVLGNANSAPVPRMVAPAGTSPVSPLPLASKIPTFVQPAPSLGVSPSEMTPANPYALVNPTAPSAPANNSKTDEPKIEDHVVPPEEAEHKPKNNPFLDWLK